MKMREISEKELKMKQHLLESPGHQKVSPSLFVCHFDSFFHCFRKKLLSVKHCLSLVMLMPLSIVLLAVISHACVLSSLGALTVTCVGFVIRSCLHCDLMSTSHHLLITD